MGERRYSEKGGSLQPGGFRRLRGPSAGLARGYMELQSTVKATLRSESRMNFFLLSQLVGGGAEWKSPLQGREREREREVYQTIP